MDSSLRLRALAAALAVAMLSPPGAGAVVNEIRVATPTGQPVNATVSITLDSGSSGPLLVERAPREGSGEPRPLILMVRPTILGDDGLPRPSSRAEPSSTTPSAPAGSRAAAEPPRTDTGLLLMITPSLIGDGPATTRTDSEEVRISAEVLAALTGIAQRAMSSVSKEEAARLQALWEAQHPQISVDARFVSTSTWDPRDLGFDPGAYGALLEGAPGTGLGRGAGGTPWVGTTDAAGRAALDTGSGDPRLNRIVNVLGGQLKAFLDSGGRLDEPDGASVGGENRAFKGLGAHLKAFLDAGGRLDEPDGAGSQDPSAWEAFLSGNRPMVSAGTDWDSASRTFAWSQWAASQTLTAALSSTPLCPNVCYTTSTGQTLQEPEQCHRIKLPAIVAQAGAAPAASGPAAGGPGGEAMREQWAFKKLGLPLRLPWQHLAPVTVAVIDTGLDYRHPALRPHHLWANPRPGADPRYPDDVIGWNFVAGHNNPWDDSGHGTFVAGLILAVNPRARIMPIKVMDTFGNGVTSDVARAVLYAVERGARVINLSIGAEGVSRLSQEVIDYARARGAVIVVAAGNESGDAARHTPANVKGVLTVGASDQGDRKPGFGNYGQPVALVAPAVDVVSLRARRSDFVLLVTRGKDYTPGGNVVGADRWHYRATGTSFSAPLVAGAASLLLSLRPSLTGPQVERMLVESAEDVEAPGWDQFTGNGRLSIARALVADPNRYLLARVARLTPAQQGGRTVVQVFGAADGNALASYQLQLGQGESPTGWKTIGVERGKRVSDGLLGAFPASDITARGKWTVRVIAQDTAGRIREARGTLDVQ